MPLTKLPFYNPNYPTTFRPAYKFQNSTPDRTVHKRNLVFEHAHEHHQQLLHLGTYANALHKSEEKIPSATNSCVFPSLLIYGRKDDQNKQYVFVEELYDYNQEEDNGEDEADEEEIAEIEELESIIAACTRRLRQLRLRL